MEHCYSTEAAAPRSLLARNAGGLGSLSSANLNRNASSSSRRFGNWSGDFQHAVLESRLRLVDVHAFRHRDQPAKLAIASLRPIPAFMLFLFFSLALAMYEQSLVGHLDLDVILAHAGQLGAHDHVVVTLEDVDRRRPGRHFAEASLMRKAEVFNHMPDCAIHLF